MQNLVVVGEIRQFQICIKLSGIVEKIFKIVLR